VIGWMDSVLQVAQTNHAAHVVIDPAGKIVYQGAIDNQPTPDPASLRIADNYLNDALNAALAGKPVAVTVTKPYGCPVKYAN
jgi:hypothetical protein